MSAALDYTYRYAFPSTVEQNRLSLATCTGEQNPYFFQGKMLEPGRVASMLLVLTTVVRTHFFLPRPPIMDPVLTSSQEMLRLEGFSGCCGVYARVDLPAAVFEGDTRGRGTTNVDFNEPMRRLLSSIRDQDEVKLEVGRDEVAVERAGQKTVEKKVKLPLRWLKCFSEVQAYQPELRPCLEVSAAEALRFLRSLPKTGQPRQASFVVPSGRGLRLSQRRARGAVTFRGTHRVAVLEPLLSRAEGLRVYFDEGTQISGWEVFGPAGRFFLLLSPEVYRGFSGEGQLLETLAANTGQDLVSRVRAQLNWQASLDPEALARQLQRPAAEVRGALAVLGSRGLAGFDVCENSYFHRELPFDLKQVDAMQPRLKGARKLLEEKKVSPHKEGEFAVVGTGVTHHVRLGESDRCTCPWFARHQGQRGPCKHILAAQMYDDR